MAGVVSLSAGHILALAASAVISAGLPVFLIVFWHRRTGAKVSSAFIGMGTFFLFVTVLEAFCNQLVLKGSGRFPAFVMSSPWAYAAYGGLAAGLFEETGRLLACRLCFRKRGSGAESVMYGIGHGGLEALLIAGIPMIMNTIAGIMSRTMGLENALIALGFSGETAIRNAAMALCGTAPYMFLIGGAERAIALALHISLSVLVFAAVKTGRKWLYPAAILLHAVPDMLACLYRTGIMTAVWAAELAALAVTAAAALAAFRIYKAWPAPKEEEPREGTDAAPGPGEPREAAPEEAGGKRQ